MEDRKEKKIKQKQKTGCRTSSKYSRKVDCSGDGKPAQMEDRAIEGQDRAKKGRGDMTTSFN